MFTHIILLLSNPLKKVSWDKINVKELL